MSQWSDPRFIIYLLPIGQVDRETLKFLADSVIKTVYCPCFILPPTELPMNIKRDHEGKIDAQDILEILTGKMPADGGRIIGVLGSGQICNIDLNLLNGCGQVPGLSAAIALQGMRVYLSDKFGGPERYRENLRRLILHELSHTLGNHECYAAHCLMDNIAIYSKTPRQFCPSCSAQIQRTMEAGPGIAKFMLGTFFYTRHNYRLAAKCYRAAAKLRPDIAEYKYYTAVAYALMNNQKKAGKWLLKYLQTTKT